MAEVDLVAGVELGGTKALAVLACGATILERARFETTTPAATLGRLRAQLESWRHAQGFSALGIASFGPIGLDRQAASFGRILATPKPGWSGAAVAELLSEGLDCPWSIDTDVNAAALAEWRWGAGHGLDSLCYLTLGTGVGGGILIGGQPVHGALHPELGHVRLHRAASDPFRGTCPFHGDCAEGLLSGPALHARFGMAVEAVPGDDPRWAFVAYDLAALIGAVALIASPRRILVGGGVGMGQPALLDRTRAALVEGLAGYLPHIDAAQSSSFVMTPALGHDAGPLGAVALAYAAPSRVAARVLGGQARCP